MHGKSFIVKIERSRTACGCVADQPSLSAALVKLPDHVSSARIAGGVGTGEVREFRVCYSQRYDEKWGTYSRVGSRRWISRFSFTSESSYADRLSARSQSRRSPSKSWAMKFWGVADSRIDHRRVLFSSTNSIVNNSYNTWDVSVNSILLSWARRWNMRRQNSWCVTAQHAPFMTQFGQ